MELQSSQKTGFGLALVFVPRARGRARGVRPLPSSAREWRALKCEKMKADHVVICTRESLIWSRVTCALSSEPLATSPTLPPTQYMYAEHVRCQWRRLAERSRAPCVPPLLQQPVGLGYVSNQRKVLLHAAYGSSRKGICCCCLHRAATGGRHSEATSSGDSIYTISKQIWDTPFRIRETSMHEHDGACLMPHPGFSF